MKDVMGIISLNESEELLGGITRDRPLAAIPFAGRYRIIDFILSSMVNAGIDNVGILVRDKYRSLMDHLRSGKEWDLARKHGGLFILPPNSGDCSILQGDVASFYCNLDYVISSPQKYVIITHSNVICNVDFTKALKHHQTVGAQITMLYKEESDGFEEFSQYTIMECDEQGWVRGLAVRPMKPASKKVSLDMYIMRKEVLVDIVQDCYARGGADLLRDGIIRKLNELKVSGYPYKGYMAKIYSVASYYRHSMELLRTDKWHELFFKSGLIYTKVKDEGPTKYQEGAVVQNSIIASGCKIAGHVENSILFRGVQVKAGAHIKNSIIMQKSFIDADSMVENAICDKDVFISAKLRFRGDSHYPLVIEKGTKI